jgi:arylsulfatase A-like enzyme
VFIFLVDDMGYNQVGYHAERVGNNEIKTLSIDAAAKTGIIMERGYMTPWCAPSRSSIQTGRTNSFNANVSNDLWAFDDLLGDGFVGGMPPGPVTIVKALKDYAAYKTSYCGKWGIGGTAWTNTPMGMGYDDFLGFFGDSIERYRDMRCLGSLYSGPSRFGYRAWHFSQFCSRILVTINFFL